MSTGPSGGEEAGRESTMNVSQGPLRWLLYPLVGLLALPGWALIAVVRVYQWTLSPLLGNRCRFTPSCSVYFIGSVRKYGVIRGSLRGVWRIFRCNPWNPGEEDLP